MKTGLDQNQLIAQMQKLAQAAKTGASQGADAASPTSKVNNAEFGSVLTKAIDKVNHYQMESSRAATQIESGDGGVSLVKAMIASQKASVAFQATLQVRNKVVSAYQDIMNMPL